MILKETPGKIGDHLYKIAPHYYRASDSLPISVATSPSSGSGSISGVETLKFFHRLLRCFGDAYDELILDKIREVLSYWDPLSAPADVLKHLSSRRGWPMDRSLPETTQRMIVKHIHDIVYMGKGNLEKIRLAILAFTGIQVTVWAPNNDPRRAMLCREVGQTGAVSGAGELSGVIHESAVIMESSDPDVEVGDEVIIQYGGSIQSGVVSSVSGHVVTVETGIQGQVQAGSSVMASPSPNGNDIPGWQPHGLGSCRLGYSRAMNCVRLNSGSLNSMLNGTARLSYLSSGPAVSDHDRRMRFSFYVVVPAAENAFATWQIKIIRFLAGYMKPARTHYILEFENKDITEPLFRLCSSFVDGGARLRGGTP